MVRIFSQVGQALAACGQDISPHILQDENRGTQGGTGWLALEPTGVVLPQEGITTFHFTPPRVETSLLRDC